MTLIQLFKFMHMGKTIEYLRTYQTDTVSYCILASICAVGVVVCLLNRKLNVNCWFCGGSSYVKKKDIVWWFCKDCCQYNGFKEDGDYNKNIPEMYDEQPYKTSSWCSDAEFKGEVFSDARLELCDSCQHNQVKKVEALRNFAATSEIYFDMECEDHERYLNKRFAPCASCTTSITDHMQQQDQQIRQLYSDELHQLRPDPLRNLHPRKRGRAMCMSYVKLAVNVVSTVTLFVIPLLLQKSLQRDVMHQEEHILVLSLFVLMSMLINIVMLTSRGNISWFKSFLISRWLILLFICNSDWNSYLRITLDIVVVIQVILVVNDIYRYLQNKWIHKRYVDERRRKIGTISPKSWTGNNSMEVQKTECDKQTRKVVKKRSTRVEHEVEFQQSTNDTNNDIKSSIVPPDLLQGHLNNMFIGKKDFVQDFLLSEERTSVNHVVAALKYRSKQNKSNKSSAIKQPLLKPATFTLPNNSLVNVINATQCKEGFNAYTPQSKGNFKDGE